MKFCIFFTLLVILFLKTHAGIYDDDVHRWEFPINYTIHSNLRHEYSDDIHNAISLILNNTCLNFTKVDSIAEKAEGIIFETGNSCSTNTIGKKYKGTNIININSQCKGNVIFIASLIIQAIGVFPEQTRYDRDDYVAINYTNIKEDTNMEFFNITHFELVSDYNTYYDYGSTVHFYPYSFAKNSNYYTISSKGPYFGQYQLMLGQKNSITFNLFKLINLRYCYIMCGGHGGRAGYRDSMKDGNFVQSEVYFEKFKEKENPCKNGGYRNPKKCSECICPFPFKNNCTDLISSPSAGCPDSIHITTAKKFTIKGNKTCYTKFTTDFSKILVFNLLELNTNKQNPCARNASMVEVKYQTTLDVMGLCFCGTKAENKANLVKAENGTLYVFYNGDKETDNVTFNIMTYSAFENDNTPNNKHKYRREWPDYDFMS